MLMFDFDYLIVLIPGMIIAGVAQMMLKSAYAKYSKVTTRRGMTGAEAAHRILRAGGLAHVGVEQARGFLSDHYDPRHKVLRLSPEVYHGNSVASVGVAAHEAGHAFQDRDRYAPLVMRNAIVPLASFGSNFSFIMLIAGMLLNITGLMYAACLLFGGVVLFQVINLPVEFNASSRARQLLVANGVVSESEEPAVGKMLNAAALTYVAGTITALLQLVYFLMKAGLLGGRDD